MNKFDYTVEFGDMSYAWGKKWAEDYDSAYEIETIIKFNDDRPDIKFTMRAGFDVGCPGYDCEYEDVFFRDAMNNKNYALLAEDCWKFTSYNIHEPDVRKNTYLVYKYYEDEINRGKFGTEILKQIFNGVR